MAGQKPNRQQPALCWPALTHHLHAASTDIHRFAFHNQNIPPRVKFAFSTRKLPFILPDTYIYIALDCPDIVYIPTPIARLVTDHVVADAGACGANKDL